jgi:glycosyltransferase involved in cell wall biosynthesis
MHGEIGRRDWRRSLLGATRNHVAVRIAIVTTSWPADERDPSGHFVRAHARALERGGDLVTVVAPAAGGAFGWPGAPARIRERPIRAFDAARWVTQARRRVEKLDVDRLIAHWAVPCAWPIATGTGMRRHARSRRLPLDVVSHGGDVRLLTRLPRPVRRAMVLSLSDRADTWQFVSADLLEKLLATLEPETRARLQRVARVEAPPIEMPDVVSAVAELRRELGARRVAVSVGRLVQSKRVDRCVEYAWRSKEIDRLVVVGDGPERARLESLAQRLGADASFVGAVGRPRALAWIGAADLLVVASEAEGLSTVVREANALGTPVVSLREE